MITNTSSEIVLEMEPLGLSPESAYPAFIFGTLVYIFIVFCNVLVLITIALSKKLHKPMFILLFNLPISDMVGAMAFYPQLLLSIATQSRLISPPACFIQAFLVHLYGTGNLLILTAMAYDRYIAICCSLRYHTIMSAHNLVIIIAAVWCVAVTLPMVLIAMAARFQFCRTNIVDMYCNNPSIVKLVCEDVSANNYYGIVITILVQGGPLVVVGYTYVQILRTCVMNRNAEARRKAIQTCGTHLVVFLILQINTATTLFAHRFRGTSPYMRRALGVSILVFPPLLDPIIYGLKTKELWENIVKLFKRNVT
ncbi:olfactory receptor 52B2-like [Genypterus blacodes]|uniref:olfactory receptor 52B2-like n=1 Tax=Genypterus blacodes TaxID=154954 RepID=UPI003F76F81F